MKDKTKLKEGEYTTIERLRNLHDIVGILDTLSHDGVVIADSDGYYDKEISDAVNELAKINARRKELIEKIMN